MSDLTLKRSEKGWIVELPEDFTDTLGVEKGSMAVLYAGEGKIEADIIPPPSKKLKDLSRRISVKYKDAFGEIKRLGD
jgi:hypothetical protein